MQSILTVTAPATVFDLTTIADVKEDLGIAGTGSDTVLQRYVSESSVQIAKACNRVFGEEDLSQMFRRDCSERTHVLILTRRPVSSIASIVEDGVTLTATDYELDADAGLLYRLSADVRTEWCSLKIVAAYTAGYDLPTDAPIDLQKAARSLVKSQWLAKGRDPLVKSEEVPGVLRQDYWVGSVPGDDGALPADVEALIAPYRDLRA